MTEQITIQQSRFQYTSESINHWVIDMADKLEDPNRFPIHWHSMALFMERAEYEARIAGDKGLMRLCGAIKGPFRQLANETDTKHRERQAQDEGDLVDCNAGRCQPERMPQTITVTFDGCQPVWDDMIEKFYTNKKFPNPLPDQMNVKDGLITASLPLLLFFGGAVKLGTKD